MADQVINTLNAKRHEIETHIGSLERDLEQARLFPRHELPKLAQEALAASPGMRQSGT